MFCSPILYCNNWSLCELDTHYILQSKALNPLYFLYKRPLLSPNGRSSPKQLLVQVTGSRPPATDTVFGAGKREGQESLKDLSVLCLALGKCSGAPEIPKEVRERKFASGVPVIFLAAKFPYLPCVFVSVMMFTATWKRTATKLGYDELLSWREQGIQQRKQQLRLEILYSLFEVTFRPQDKQGEKHFQKTEGARLCPVLVRKVEMFDVSFTVVLSIKIKGSWLCPPPHHILLSFKFGGWDFFLPLEVLLYFSKCLVVLGDRFTIQLFGFWSLFKTSSFWGGHWKEFESFVISSVCLQGKNLHHKYDCF